MRILLNINYLLTCAACLLFTHAAQAQSQGNFKYKNAQQLDQRSNVFNEVQEQYNAPIQQSRGNVFDNSQIVTQGSLNALNDTTFYISATVMLNEVAAEHVAIFSLTQIGLSADSANAQMQESIENFIDELARLNIPRNHVFIDMISLVPRYEIEIEKKVFSKKAKEVPKGFELKKNIHVRYQNDQIFNDIILAATRSEIYDLVKVDYFIPNIDKIYSQLREEAVRLINDKKKAHERLGVTFDTTYNRSVLETKGSWYPADRYFDYTAFSGSSMDVLKKKKLDATSTIEKNVTQFYHKVPYNQFDLVINPVVLEPAVQFYYKMAVKFTLKRKRITPPPPAPQPVEPVYYKLDENIKMVVPLKKLE